VICCEDWLGGERRIRHDVARAGAETDLVVSMVMPDALGLTAIQEETTIMNGMQRRALTLRISS